MEKFNSNVNQSSMWLSGRDWPWSLGRFSGGVTPQSFQGAKNANRKEQKCKCKQKLQKNATCEGKRGSEKKKAVQNGSNFFSGAG